MAALTITAANVVAGGTAVTETGTAGATITAGQAVYKAGDGTLKLSDANLAGAKDFYGIALNGASAGQPLTVLKLGQITIGATMTAGTTYAVGSATAGSIVPQADLTTGDAVLIIGVAISTTVLDVKPHLSGVTL